MNLTVGPLPPAVYWRRRALVLGAVLALVILLVSTCGGAKGDRNLGNTVAARSTVSGSPSPAATPSVQAPIVGAPGGASGAPSGAASPTAAASAATEICSDAEIQLTPSAQKINGGSYPYQLNLRIKNVSNRTCKRDVGSGPQELHIVNASGQTVWSSDNCQSATVSDVRTFGPNIEAAFQLGWDGKANAPGCVPTNALNGSYTLVAKLDTKVSAPVAFTIGPVGITQAGK